MRRSTGATEPVCEGACQVTRPAGRARIQYGENCTASRGPWLDLQPAELEQRRASFPSNPRGARGTTEQDRVRNIGIARRALPPPGSAEPGRSTWNMASDWAGVRPPLNTRAHGHGGANSSDDPDAGPWDRGPSEQTPGPGHHPRAGLASDGSGLRFYPSTSQPVERAALARRIADGIRALVTPRLVLSVHGAARGEALPAGDIRVRVPRGTSRSSGAVAGLLGGVAHAAGSLLLPTREPTRATRICDHSSCGRLTADGPSPRLVGRCVVCPAPTMDGETTPPASASERPRPWTSYSLGEGRLFRIRSNKRPIGDKQTGFRSSGCLFGPVGGPRSLGSSPQLPVIATAPPAKSGPCDHAVVNSASGAVQSATEGAVGPNGERLVRTLPINVWQTAEQSVRVPRCRSIAGAGTVPAWRHDAVSGSASTVIRASVPRGTSRRHGHGGDARRCGSHGAQCRPDAGDTRSGSSLGLIRLSTLGYRGEAGAFSTHGRRSLQPTGGRVLHARDGGSGCNRAVLSDDRPWGDRSMSECPSVSWPGGRS